MNIDNEKELNIETSCECCSDVCTANTKKKPLIVTPVIIAAVALLLVAAITLGGITLYKSFFKSGTEGVWEMVGTEGNGIYFEFGKPDNNGKGDINLKGGGVLYYGTYEYSTCNVNDKNVPDFVKDISAVEPLSGEVGIFKSDFYMLGTAGGQFIYERGSEDGKDTITLKCLGYTGVSEIKFVESELPELKIEPQTITNASADEAGIKTLVVDNKIVGRWEDPDYGTYTFNSDGTGSYRTKYQLDPMYTMYGVNSGYGFEMDFKYTTGDGKIYFTVEYYVGDPLDGIMTYYLDGDNLVVDNMGYKKVK